MFFLLAIVIISCALVVRKGSEVLVNRTFRQLNNLKNLAVAGGYYG